MRCIALAEACIAEGKSVTIASAQLPKGLAKQVLERNIAIHNLKAQSGTVQDSIETGTLANKISASAVVVDGYDFGETYLSKLKETNIPLIVFDDCGHFNNRYPDCVINQNLAATPANYQAISPQCRLFLGTRYTMLRKEFLCREPKTIEDQLSQPKLLVTAGGADPHNISAKILSSLSTFTDSILRITVVVGEANPHLESLCNLAKENRHSIDIIQSPRCMAILMQEADLAITAGGSTCWELLHIGIPFISVATSENQRFVCEALAHLECSLYAGWWENLQVGIFPALLARLLNVTGLRKALSTRGRQLCDGEGAPRLAKTHLFGLSHQSAIAPNLRRCELTDAYQIWQLRNEPTARANSIQTDMIPIQKHVPWFANRLASVDCSWWVYEIAGEVAGQVRYDRLKNGSTIDISISVGKRWRSSGLAYSLIRDTRRLAIDELGCAVIQAHVKSVNEASLRLFRKLEFVSKCSCNADESVRRLIWNAPPTIP